MEHQQAQHHQLAALEVSTKILKFEENFLKIFFVLQGFENSNARALVVKGINVLLTLLQVCFATSDKGIFEQKKCSGRPASPCNVCSNPKTLPSNSHQSCHHGNFRPLHQL